MRAPVHVLLSNAASRIRHVRERDSNTQMDLIKLYGMFCVVYAHTYNHGISIPGFGVISSVYVIQLFIFCSGFFYNREMDGNPRYLLKCVKGYLLPYFCWNLIYGIIHEVLYAVGIVQFGGHLSLYSLFVRPWLDAEQYGLNIPSWFLLSLFLSAVCVWALRTLFSKIRTMRWKADILLLFLLLGVSFLTLLWVGEGGYYPNRGAVARPLILMAYFQLGIVYRAYGTQLRRRTQVILFVLLGLALLGIHALDDGLRTKMLYCYFVGNPLLLLLGALASVGFITLLCGFLAPLLKRFRIFRYGGRCTMYMMLHHMFVLWGIQAILFTVNHFWPLTGYNAANFRASIWYRFCFNQNWILLVYIFAAMAIPLFLHWIYEIVILKISKISDFTFLRNCSKMKSD